MPQVTREHQNKIREKILKSTYRLFVAEGERMTTQMVCDDAHVSKGTLFHYFGSKEMLLRTAYISAHEHAGRLSCEGMEFSGSEKEIVHELIRRSLTWAVEFPEEVRRCADFVNFLRQSTPGPEESWALILENARAIDFADGL